jgi:hypothetical protein
MRRDFLRIEERASFHRPLSDSHKIPARAGAPTSARAMAWVGAVPLLAAAAGALLVTVAPAWRSATTYATASAPTQSVTVAVRFVAEASAADIAGFLTTYNASLIEPPRDNGFHRIRFFAADGSKADLAQRIARMRQEPIVDSIAAQQ